MNAESDSPSAKRRKVVVEEKQATRKVVVVEKEKENEISKNDLFPHPPVPKKVSNCFLDIRRIHGLGLNYADPILCSFCQKEHPVKYAPEDPTGGEEFAKMMADDERAMTSLLSPLRLEEEEELLGAVGGEPAAGQ